MDVPIAVCAAEATAIRLARKRYVQGCDGPAHTAIVVIEPTREDIADQGMIDAKRNVMAKAKSAGLTDEELAALAGITKGR